MYNLVLLFTLIHFDCIPACHYLVLQKLLVYTISKFCRWGSHQLFLQTPARFFFLVLSQHKMFSRFLSEFWVYAPHGYSHNENLFIGLSCKIYAALKAAKRNPLPGAPGVKRIGGVCVCLGVLVGFKGLSTR